MIVEVKVPQLSESVAEATLLDWHKKEGERVSRDENLIDIETDKVVLELPAPADGVLVKILKKARDSVGSGDVIAQIDTEGQGRGRRCAVSGDRSRSCSGNGANGPPVMPAAQKIAAEKGIDTSKVQGTGRDGRVTKGDVLEATSTPRAPAAAADAAGQRRAAHVGPPGAARADVAPAPARGRAAGAVAVDRRDPHHVQRSEHGAGDRDAQDATRSASRRSTARASGFMSFFVKAAVHALKRFPVVNASIDGTDIVYHGYFDIGVAVGSPRGLVVPILRDADRMSFAEIEKKIGDFGKRAQDGKLAIEELTGGTFSISNGGVFGSMLSTPIINPPQSAILGVHATKDRAVVESGPGRGAADELPRAVLRPSDHRRPRSGFIFSKY